MAWIRRPQTRLALLGALALLGPGCPDAPLVPSPPGETPASADLGQGSQDGAAPPDLGAAELGQAGWRSALWQRFVDEGPGPGRLPDFSRAGFRFGDEPLPEFHARTLDATRFGAVPDDGKDDTAAIQAALDEAGRLGGGLVVLPPGRFDVHSTAAAPFLAIRFPRVVLRGAGPAEPSRGGTLLYLGAPAPYDGKTALSRPGANLAIDPRRFAAIAIMGPADPGTELARYAAPLGQGQDLVTLDSTAALRPGQLVRLVVSSQGVSSLPDLPAQLTAPLRLTPQMSVTTGPAGQSISWLATVSEVRGGGQVRLDQAARFDQALAHGPRLMAFPGLEGAGIERLRIGSAWAGGYAHHKPFPWGATDKTATRTTVEQDYLWVAVWISQAQHGFVRDVTITDCTQGLRLTQSAHFTIDRVRHEGLGGHQGIHLARAHGVLVRDFEAHARLVHPVTVESWSSGNVYLRARCAYEGSDEATGTGPHIDFHGLFPYENLFDGLRGCYVRPGGDNEVMPHAGVRNTFWNMELPPGPGFRPEDFGEAEFFRTPKFTMIAGATAADAHQHFPQSFVIGAHRQGGAPIAYGGAPGDRADRWLTIEGDGRGDVQPPSLYEAQVALRRARRP